MSTERSSNCCRRTHRGLPSVLNPSMELIDVNALLHDDMVNRAAVNNLIGGLACTPCTPTVSSCCK